MNFFFIENSLCSDQLSFTITRSNEEIIQLIRNGEHDDIGAEKLRGLLKILPEVDELDMLKCFNGDKCRLGNAEKFLMQLSQVPK